MHYYILVIKIREWSFKINLFQKEEKIVTIMITQMIVHHTQKESSICVK